MWYSHLMPLKIKPLPLSTQMELIGLFLEENSAQQADDTISKGWLIVKRKGLGQILSPCAMLRNVTNQLLHLNIAAKEETFLKMGQDLPLELNQFNSLLNNYLKWMRKKQFFLHLTCTYSTRKLSKHTSLLKKRLSLSMILKYGSKMLTIILQ